MKPKQSIAVVDDHFLFRKGLINLFREFDHINVQVEAENGKDLLEKLKSQQPLPDVIFLDIEMPVMNGIEATKVLKKYYPGVKVVILSMHYEEELMCHMMELGAHGFLSKNTDVKVMLEAVDLVMEKGYYFDFDISKAMAKGILQSSSFRPVLKASDLSGKELEILKLICTQKTNREIADTLYLSPRTIDTYRERILKKTGARNAVGLAFYALKYGLIDLRSGLVA
ncbi:MAG: response regulator [Bacteroidia bacterium]